MDFADGGTDVIQCNSLRDICDLVSTFRGQQIRIFVDGEVVQIGFPAWNGRTSITPNGTKLTGAPRNKAKV